jgi:hypothetical protein
VPTKPPRLASLNGTAVGSSWMTIAFAVWTLRPLGPSNSIGWPKATALSSQTNVVVPIPALLR